jgi:hypothetical protein
MALRLMTSLHCQSQSSCPRVCICIHTHVRMLVCMHNIECCQSACTYYAHEQRTHVYTYIHFLHAVYDIFFYTIRTILYVCIYIRTYIHTHTCTHTQAHTHKTDLVGHHAYAYVSFSALVKPPQHLHLFAPNLRRSSFLTSYLLCVHT